MYTVLILTKNKRFLKRVELISFNIKYQLTKLKESKFCCEIQIGSIF